MALSKKPYKGTRDFFPKEKSIQDYMFNNMRKAAELFGYESYDGPMLEEVELYKAKSGEELINDQIYSFTDRGNRFVAIRPEMTPTVARMVASIHKEEAKPLRWYCVSNLYRYEKPQRGRLREFWQFNCDIFGAPGRQGEIEALQVAISLLENYGATSDHFEVLLNDRTIVDTIFTDLMGCNSEVAYKLYKIVDKAMKVPNEAVLKMLNELELSEHVNTIFLSYLKLKSFEDVISFLKEHNKEEQACDLQNFITDLDHLGLLQYVKYEATVVRGLDYYTGIVFEVFDKHPENRRAICGGGAYANLLKIFNEQPLHGVGFAFGDVTLKDFLETHNLLPNLERPSNDIFITFQDEGCKIAALKFAMELRRKDIKVITHLEPLKFKKVFKEADKKGAQFVAMMGDRELETESIQIKNLESKEQTTIKLTDINKFIELLQVTTCQKKLI